MAFQLVAPNRSVLLLSTSISIYCDRVTGYPSLFFRFQSCLPLAEMLSGCFTDSKGSRYFSPTRNNKQRVSIYFCLENVNDELPSRSVISAINGYVVDGHRQQQQPRPPFKTPIKMAFFIGGPCLPRISRSRLFFFFHPRGITLGGLPGIPTQL